MRSFLFSVVASLLFLLLQPRLVNSKGVASLDQPFTDSFSHLPHAACVTLFHRNGRMGCGTQDHSLDIGNLVYFDGTNLPGENAPAKYVIVMEEYDLTAQTIETLSTVKGGRLQGILVLNSTSYSSSSSSQTSSVLSPDAQTPQGYNTPSVNVNYGYYSYPWNSKGENLFSYDLYGVSMAYVYDSDVCNSLRKESQAGSSNVVAEFNYYMGPEQMNSPECLAWKDVSDEEWRPKCLPLGGTSVWASAGSPPVRNEQYYNNNNNNNNDNNGERNLDNARRSVLIVSAGMDSTSMFHDLTPGANTAASNILTLLMAAKLIGGNVNDQELDGLPNRIVFALFQAETYGFVGSRAFLRDLAYPGFQCNSSPVPSSTKQGDASDYGCLNPLRPSLRFADLGQIAGMLSVDQVGHAVGDGIIYVHADQDNDSFGALLTNFLKYSSTNDVSVAASNAGNNDDGGFPYPPSPLTSLLQLSGGGVGGAVLTGYDYAFTSKVPYHSHKDSASEFSIELDTIAGAATIMARTALAVAYDDGTYSGQGDYETPTSYAKNLIPQLGADDETLVELANCLLVDGQCDLIRKYSSTEMDNEKARTGADIGKGQELGTPPNYYAGTYNYYYGQPFVQVGSNIYGAYDGEDYGKKNTDAITMMPRQLESTIYGLFNDFLGRGSTHQNSGSDQSCKKSSDCGKVDYCGANGDSATCTGGGMCVCQRAHYHIALDEGLLAAENKPTGYFVVDENDQGISAMYTEPYWSPYVGIRVYRDVGPLPGFIALAVGMGVLIASLFGALVLKVGLKKEKLY